MKNKTNTKPATKNLSKLFALGRLAAYKAQKKAQKKALVAARLATLKFAKDDSNFTHVAELNPGHTLRRGAGTGWCAKVTLVGRRHRCACCNKIVPVEQESSNYCSGKCERMHRTQMMLKSYGF